MYDELDDYENYDEFDNNSDLDEILDNIIIDDMIDNGESDDSDDSGDNFVNTFTVILEEIDKYNYKIYHKELINDLFYNIFALSNIFRLINITIDVNHDQHLKILAYLFGTYNAETDTIILENLNIDPILINKINDIRPAIFNKFNNIDTDNILCFDCFRCNNCKLCNNCRYCDNCNYCVDCNNCEDCNKCNACNDCNNCKKCIVCNDCENCKKCVNCEKCYICKKCNGCNKCNNSILCFDCDKLYTCNYLYRCSHCEYTDKCIKCKYLKRCNYLVHAIKCSDINGTYKPFDKNVREIYDLTDQGDRIEIYYNKCNILFANIYDSDNNIVYSGSLSIYKGNMYAIVGKYYKNNVVVYEGFFTNKYSDNIDMIEGNMYDFNGKLINQIDFVNTFINKYNINKAFYN